MRQIIFLIMCSADSISPIKLEVTWFESNFSIYTFSTEILPHIEHSPQLTYFISKIYFHHFFGGIAYLKMIGIDPDQPPFDFGPYSSASIIYVGKVFPRKVTNKKIEAYIALCRSIHCANWPYTTSLIFGFSHKIGPTKLGAEASIEHSFLGESPLGTLTFSLSIVYSIGVLTIKAEKRRQN